MLILIVGLILFLGIHSVSIFARPWRDARLASLGEGPWKGVYSLVSLVGLVLIGWGYARARPDAADLYVPPVWMAHLSMTLMALAFIAFAVSMFPAGRLKAMLKHPQLLSVKIWAFAHLLVNGDTASLLLFGTFLAWAVADRISVKRRGAAIASPGPVTWDIAAVIVGLGAWWLFIGFLHEWLFGVPLSFSM